MKSNGQIIIGLRGRLVVVLLCLFQAGYVQLCGQWIPPDAYLENRWEAVIIDGLVDAEWEKHELHEIELSAGSATQAVWRGTYDNSYYYFLVEVTDPDGSKNRISLNMYGANPCQRWIESPEDEYVIHWRQNEGAVDVRRGPVDGSGFVYGAHDEVADHHVLTASHVSETGYQVEFAIPGVLIGSSLGAGGDWNWTSPIRMTLQLRDDTGNSNYYSYWPARPEYDICTYGLIDFEGWPGNAIQGEPGSVRVDVEGGEFESVISFADPDETLAVTFQPYWDDGIPYDADWATVSLQGRTLQIATEPNMGAHRFGYAVLKSEDEVAFGAVRIEQYGLSGSPWTFEFKDPVSLGDYYSSWFEFFQMMSLEMRFISTGVHGILSFRGIRSDSIFFYDHGMGQWWWSGEGAYPFMYVWNENAGWYWFYRNSKPGARWFYDYQNSSWRNEQEM